jgi:hypothetical protein
MNILLRNMNYKDSKIISDCFKEKGIVYGVKFLGYGEETVVDDDLCLMMIKKLK